MTHRRARTNPPRVRFSENNSPRHTKLTQRPINAPVRKVNATYGAGGTESSSPGGGVGTSMTMSPGLSVGVGAVVEDDTGLLVLDLFVPRGLPVYFVGGGLLAAGIA